MGTDSESNGLYSHAGGENGPCGAYSSSRVDSNRLLSSGPGAEYVIYIPREYPSAIWVNLSKAKENLRVEWFNLSTGKTAGDGIVKGRETRVFLALFEDDAVLILRSI